VGIDCKASLNLRTRVSLRQGWNQIRIVGVGLALFIFSQAAYPQEVSSWTPQLETTEGRLRLVQSVFDRHPQLPSANLQFRINPLTILKPIPALLQKLEANAQSLEIAPSVVSGVSFVTTQIRYDLEKLNAVREYLKTHASRLNLNSFKEFDGDLESLKSAFTGDTKSFEKQVYSLLLLAPFIYNAQGELLKEGTAELIRQQIFASIEAVSASELSNYYGDFLPNHFSVKVSEAAAKPGFGRVTNLLKRVAIEFSEALVAPAVKPVDSNSSDSVEVRKVSIEKMSSSITSYRAMAAGDCAGLSIPYYGLIKDVEVFWIRKDFKIKSAPVGYVLVAKIFVGNKFLPYVITVNGSTLMESDIRAVLYLLQDSYQTSEFVVPDFIKNEYVVNYPEVRKGLSFSREISVEISMPPGWELVESYLDSRGSQYKNYYAARTLKNAKLVNLNEKPFYFVNKMQSPSFLPYKEVSSVLAAPLLERGILAGQATLRDHTYAATDQKTEMSNEEKQAVYTSLGVTEEQAYVSRYLTMASSQSPIDKNKFESLKTHLGFKLNDLNKLDVVTRAYSYAKLREEAPEIADEKTWNDLAISINHYLEIAAVGVEDALESSVKLKFIEAKSKLPGHLIGDAFWVRWPSLLRQRDSKVVEAAMKALIGKGDLPDEVWQAIEEKCKGNQAGSNDFTKNIFAIKQFNAHSEKTWKFIGDLIHSAARAYIYKNFGASKAIVEIYLRAAPQEIGDEFLRRLNNKLVMNRKVPRTGNMSDSCYFANFIFRLELNRRIERHQQAEAEVKSAPEFPKQANSCYLLF